MTEPQPYPGDLPAAEQPTRLSFEAGYFGTLAARNDRDEYIPVFVEEGLILTALPPGTYRLVGTLAGPGGAIRYVAETVTL